MDYYLLVIFITQVTANDLANKSGTFSNLCKKEYFVKTYVAQDKALTPNVISNIRSCDLMCSEALLSYQFMEDPMHNLHLIVGIDDQDLVNKTKDCWGLYFHLESQDSKTNFFEYINFNTTNMLTTYGYSLSTRQTRYILNMVTLPIMRTATVNFTRSSACAENLVNKLIYTLNKNTSKCINKHGNTVMYEAALSICQKETDSDIQYSMIVKTMQQLRSECYNGGNDSLSGLVCNKMWFIKEIATKDSYLELSRGQRKKIRSECILSKCNSAKLSYMYGVNNNLSTYSYIVEIDDMIDHTNSDCWGYIFILVKYQHKVPVNTTVFYINFKDRKNTWELVVPDGEYDFKVVTVPSMLQKAINTPQYNECQKDVLSNVMNKIEGSECIGRTDMVEIVKYFATPLCKLYPDKSRRDAKVDKYFKENNPPCPFKFVTSIIPATAQNLNEKKKLSTLVVALIIVSSLTLFSTVSVMVAHKFYRRRQEQPLRQDNSNDNLVSSRDKGRSKYPTASTWSNPDTTVTEC